MRRSQVYWFELLPDGHTVFFQFNAVVNVPLRPFDRFVDQLFDFIDERKARRLVIDLRWNNGGNSLLLPPLLRALAQDRTATSPGNLFVIVGRHTFSAGMTAATLIERHSNATFVGEPTPSSPNHIGEVNILRLPCHPRVHVSISDLYWQDSWPFDRRTWIAPLIHAPPTFEDYGTNRDAALEAILAVPMN